MAQRIVLIDGHSILNRAFYGVPDLTNSEGLHTNAVYGFLNIMFRELDEEKPDFLAVAFDRKEPTFRHQMYAEYKGTRKGMPDELHEQVPIMKEVLRAMGVTVMELPGFEADDILGTMAKRSEELGRQVTILSGDRDLLQLATDQIRICIPRTRKGETTYEYFDAAGVKEAYGVTPTEFIDMKALMGDTSDNIPGVPGIGEKGAGQIIAQYGSIENAYAHVAEIKAKRARESLSEHYDMAQMSKVLATIEIHAPIEEEWLSCPLTDLYTPEAYEMVKRLDFKSIAARFQVPAVKEETVFTLVRTKEEAEAFFHAAEGADLFGFSWILEEEEPIALSLCVKEAEAVSFVIGEELPFDWLLKKLIELLGHAGRIATIGWKKTCLLSPEAKAFTSSVMDCEVGAYLLNPLKNSYAADDIARDILQRTVPSYTELAGKASFGELLEKKPEVFAQAAGREAWVAFLAAKPIEEALAAQGMKSLYEEIELPLIPVLADMELAGVRVEKEALAEYGRRLQEKIDQVQKEIYEETGEVFNINSPKQLGEILFERMKLPGGKKTKSGYSTAADVLEKLAPDVPVVRSILDYRQYTKLKSTYADGLAGYIREDGRIHGRFHQTVTATGRLSSTDPNLQNIPVRMELGREIRKLFVPEEGCVLIDADYSQIELRVLAHMSQDTNLIEAYGQAQDIHAITASKVFHVPLEEVTPLLRRSAKAVNFGIVYGISAFGLSEDLSISRKQASEYIEQYFKTYPRVKAFLDKCVSDAKESGCSVTMYGRRRPMPELKSSNFMQRQFGERVAMNAPIQGTAADIIKIAMIRVYERLKKENLKTRLILQVHDELILEAPVEETEKASAILREEMQQAAELAVKLEVDLHIGKSWFEAK